MTELDLYQLQQEWEATTQSKWKCVVYSKRERQYGYAYVDFQNGDYYTTSPLQTGDAPWIAHAHEVYPLLIQRIRQLEEEIRLTKEYLGQ